jgi:uncharacterized protein YndB with AHSA1/START domain
VTKNSTVRNRHGSAVITVPSDTEILITRVFDAPAALIFRALTELELVRRWWGFDSSEWLVCEIDLRVGGAWRFVTREGDMEVGFHGEYRELDPPHRIVQTEIYEGAPEPYPNDAAVNTLTLSEADGVTTMTTLVSVPNRETRDAILASGMEGGLQVSYNRLEELLREKA